MVGQNLIESDSEILAEKYLETRFPNIKEKMSVEVAEYIKRAFSDGFVNGADNIIRRVKIQFEELTTHSKGGYRGQ